MDLNKKTPWGTKSVRKNPTHKDAPVLIGYAAVFAAAALWGASGVWVRFIADNEAVSPTALAFWRDFATFLCLLFLGLVTTPDKMRINRSDWRDMIGMGACLGLFHIFYNASILLNGAAVTTIQQAIMPVIVAVVARLLWQEPLTFRKILAILMAFCGAVLVSGLTGTGSGKLTFSGLLLGLSVPCFYAGWNLFGKKVRMQYDSIIVLVFAFGTASVLLLPLQFFVPQPWSPHAETWLWFAGLIGLSTLGAFYLYAVGIGRLQAGVASILLMSEIAFAVLYAYFLLHERLGVSKIIGLILVVVGVLQLLRSGNSMNRQTR
jgi:drug/metabolite transporter (DMT)-like permease